MAAKFEIQKASNGQFFFRLKAENGEIILSSEQYTAKANAQSGIDSVKANASLADRYERKTSSSSQNYYILKAANGETLGTSEMYSSAAGMEKGLESVRTNASTAAVMDLT